MVMVICAGWVLALLPVFRLAGRRPHRPGWEHRWHHHRHQPTGERERPSQSGFRL